MLATSGVVRKYERAIFLCRVDLSVGSESSPITMSSLDISLGGVGLISRVILPIGRPVSLAFHLKNAAQVPVIEYVQGRVVHARTDIDGHHLGVEFQESLQRSCNPHLTRKVENL